VELWFQIYEPMRTGPVAPVLPGTPLSPGRPLAPAIYKHIL